MADKEQQEEQREEQQEKQQEKTPKIIVDDDWKTQAKAEKEKLAEQVEGAGQADAAQAPGESRQLPPASFSVLISSLVTQVFFALGAIEDPQTKQRFLDLDMARHHIDILAMLEEKTKGNLTDDEKKILDRAIYESRMQYVQAAQHASRAAPGAGAAAAGA